MREVLATNEVGVEVVKDLVRTWVEVVKVLVRTGVEVVKDLVKTVVEVVKDLVKTDEMLRADIPDNSKLRWINQAGVQLTSHVTFPPVLHALNDRSKTAHHVPLTNRGRKQTVRVSLKVTKIGRDLPLQVVIVLNIIIKKSVLNLA